MIFILSPYRTAVGSVFGNDVFSAFTREHYRKYTVAIFAEEILLRLLFITSHSALI